MARAELRLEATVVLRGDDSFLKRIARTIEKGAGPGQPDGNGEMQFPYLTSGGLADRVPGDIFVTRVGDVEPVD